MIQSPVARNEQQRHREEMEWQLIKERGASRPDEQFDEEVDVQKKRTINAYENRTLVLPNGANLWSYVSEIVKQNWVEQGIWRDEWADEPGPHARWLHGPSPEPSPASKANREAPSMSNPFGETSEQPGSGSTLKARENSEKAP